MCFKGPDCFSPKINKDKMGTVLLFVLILPVGIGILLGVLQIFSKSKSRGAALSWLANNGFDKYMYGFDAGDAVRSEL
jgi:hypothetical protein